MNRLSIDEFHQSQKIPIVVVLDNVRSQHNIGAVFRTADAFRLQGIMLCGICSYPPNTEIHKTALGAEDSVDWTFFEHTCDAINTLREQGYTIYAIEQAHNSIPLNTFHTKTDQPIAIVFGHEVFGVDQQIVDMCDGCIEIPQYGTKHSLNVSVAAGITIYTIANQYTNLLQ